MTRSLCKIARDYSVLTFLVLFTQIPSVYAQQATAFATDDPPVMSGEPMDGPSPGMSMHDMMRGPNTTALYPTMINSSKPTPKERERMVREAQRWTAGGITLLTEGAEALTEATGNADVARMRTASTRIGEGLSRLESGLSTRQALAGGEAPSAEALRWFKSQLNLTAEPEARQQQFFWGMTPLNFFICLLMLVSIGLALAIYLLRMRRAYHLLERMEASRATAVDSPQRDINLDAAGATAGSEGLLPIRRKKLCRLRVARIYPETPDVKTFRFVSCDHGPIPFSYLPGQFLTLTLPVEDSSIKRSYTISSSPTQGYYCEISVKREQQGIGSRYLHDVLKEGDTLDVRGPSGKLTFTGAESDSIVLIGGGIGITPMMSVARALADMGWKGEIILIICCSDSDHFIFGADLERLQERNSNLRVLVAMSTLQEDLPNHHRGRLSKECLLDWIPDISSRSRIHLCASPQLMDAIQLMLADLGVASDSIKTESFGSQEKPHARERVQSIQESDRSEATVEFKLSGKSTTIQGDETILEAAERMGVDMNYSCRVGGCGECSVKIISGEVDMDVDDALEPNEKAAGIILACQARPTTNVIIEA